MLITPSPPSIPTTTGPTTGPTTVGTLSTTGSTTVTPVRFPASVVALSGATYIARHPSLPVFYVTQELGRNGRVVSAIRRNAQGRWRTLAQATVGDAPVHVVADNAGTYVYISSYTGGSVTQIALTTSGGFGRATTVAMPPGSGSNPTRQNGPHPHSTAISPDGRTAIVADLGTDSLHVIDTTSMRLLSTQRLPADSGPRTVLFANSSTVVVSEELGNAVSFWDFDATHGLTLRSRLPLDPGATPSDVVARNTTSAAAPALFVLERGPDRITEISGEAIGRRWATPNCGARSATWLADGTLALACTKGGEVRVLRFTSTGAAVVGIATVPRAAGVREAR